MKLGMVGLPNVGKSTLFNALTNAGAESANYPFCTIEKNIGIVSVPDERLSAYLIILTFSRILIAYSFFVSSNVSIAPNPLACFFMISYPGCSLNPG